MFTIIDPNIINKLMSLGYKFINKGMKGLETKSTFF